MWASVSEAQAEENDRLVAQTPPIRLRAHRQAGFMPVAHVVNDILTQAVEARNRYIPATAFFDLHKIVQLNLIRLFQLAVFFDDHFPRNKGEKPSTHLLKALRKEWDVDIPGLEDQHIWEILDDWYYRHLYWWKQNRHSKHHFEEESSLLLITLMDEYRRSRRTGKARRDREGKNTTDKDDAMTSMAASVLSSLVSGSPQGSDVLAAQVHHFVSTYLFWKKAEFNHPQLLYSRILPVPPLLDKYLQTVSLQTSRALIVILGDMKKPGDQEWLSKAADMRSPCLWITQVENDSTPINESYRALPNEDTDSSSDSEQESEAPISTRNNHNNLQAGGQSRNSDHDLDEDDDEDDDEDEEDEEDEEDDDEDNKAHTSDGDSKGKKKHHRSAGRDNEDEDAYKSINMGIRETRRGVQVYRA